MPKLYTIGHSTHTLEEFINILKAYGITNIVDIRTVPKSQYVPWFNKDQLCDDLAKEKIRYKHLPQLGGLRHPLKDSINTAWNNTSFRGYADYMQTHEFYQALKELNQLIKQNEKVAIMCSEAIPWRCHRSLIADAEIIRGTRVYHIISKTQALMHNLTSFAVVDRSKRPLLIYYPS